MTTSMFLFTILAILAPCWFVLVHDLRAARKAQADAEVQAEPMTFIIHRDNLRCISEVWVCNDGMTWMLLCDELLLSVVYEDEGYYTCVPAPGQEWLARDYVDEGMLPPPAAGGWAGQ